MEQQRVIGKLEEQSRHLETRLNRIESKVDLVLSGYWKIYGMAMVAAFAATILVELVRAG